jgi:hypothetical protein
MADSLDIWSTWGRPHNERPRPPITPQLHSLNRDHCIMEIRNPRRILALGAPESGVLSLLKGTGAYHPALLPLTCTPRSHRLCARPHHRQHRRPVPHLAPHHKILHRHSAHLDRRNPFHPRLAHRIHKARSPRSSYGVGRMDILLPKARYHPRC